MREYVERSCHGCGRVTLHDVDDSHAFVQATINRSGLSLTREQRDELASEGLRALTRMARDYQPGRGGRDPAGSTFAGYAAKFLPGKLSDAWHRIQDHSLVTQGDGSRKWDVDRQRPASLEAIAMNPDGGGLDSISSLQVEPEWEPETLSELPKLLADWWDERTEQLIQYAQMRTDGFHNAEIMVEMRLVPGQLKELEAFNREMLRRLRRLAGVARAA